jgi:hypothetical protein
MSDMCCGVFGGHIVKLNMSLANCRGTSTGSYFENRQLLECYPTQKRLIALKDEEA